MLTFSVTSCCQYVIIWHIWEKRQLMKMWSQFNVYYYNIEHWKTAIFLVYTINHMWLHFTWARAIINIFKVTEWQITVMPLIGCKQYVYTKNIQGVVNQTLKWKSTWPPIMLVFFIARIWPVMVNCKQNDTFHNANKLCTMCFRRCLFWSFWRFPELYNQLRKWESPQL